MSPVPEPGRLTSGQTRSKGALRVPMRQHLLRPSKGVNLQVPHAGATLIFKIRGFYAGVWETWVSTSGALAPAPSGHPVTHISFTMTSVD